MQLKQTIQLLVNLFVYASIVGLVIYVARLDKVYLVTIVEVGSFIASIAFLLLGFLLQATSWHLLVNGAYPEITYTDSFKSVAITIFGKYLPGKVWMILGRVGYLASRYDTRIRELGLLATVVQIMAIVSGGIIGIQAICIYAKLNISTNTFLWVSTIIVIVAGIALTLLWLSQRFKTMLSMPSIRYSGRAFLACLTSWLCWGIGFAFLIASFNSVFLYWNISIFAAAAVLGILAIFAPGGLGVREGCMAFLLVFQYGDTELALIYSTVARLWFLFGELVFFILGILLSGKPANHDIIE